ncbi:hypothetical protein LSAT2_022348 [Lamellibrachia satsuma]|nr:hypothetical protein LSAT2_022348 [Lamellibrachia satsuma]
MIPRPALNICATPRFKKCSYDEGGEFHPTCPGWERMQLETKQAEKKDEKERWFQRGMALCALCETEVDECASQPCHNGGVCTGVLAGYVCKCSLGYGGQSCDTVVSPDFDLVFHRASTTDYVLLRTIPTLHALSVCLWLRTNDFTNYGTILSYAAESNWLTTSDVNVFTLYDYGGLRMSINGEIARTDLVLNDGRWHHLCVTWQGAGGEWSLYINGSKVIEGAALGNDTIIEGGGYLVIGQYQDWLGGGFNSRESFVGEMSQLNVYDEVLLPSVVAELANKTSCNMASAGNVVAWTDMLDHTLGDVRVVNEAHCLDANACVFPDVVPCSTKRRCTLGSYYCDQCREDMPGVDCRLFQCLCLNGATCTEKDNVCDYDIDCVCTDGFTGRYCEFQLESCDSNSCSNGGTCVSDDHQVPCLCPDGFTGSRCENQHSLLIPTTPPDYCTNVKCLNGGTCTVLADGFHCYCQEMFKGRYCYTKREKRGTQTAAVDLSVWNYVLLVALTIALLICLVVLMHQRCRRINRSWKRNNFGEGIALNRINNDVPRMITPEPPTPPPRPIDFFDHKDKLDENIYSEISDVPILYIVAKDLQKRHSSDIEHAGLGRRFPSKRGREMNHDRGAKPLPDLGNVTDESGYLSPCQGPAPPGYHELDASCKQANLSVERIYLTPISDEEAEELEQEKRAKKSGKERPGMAGKINRSFVDDDLLPGSEVVSV